MNYVIELIGKIDNLNIWRQPDERKILSVMAKVAPILKMKINMLLNAGADYHILLDSQTICKEYLEGRYDIFHNEHLQHFKELYDKYLLPVFKRWIKEWKANRIVALLGDPKKGPRISKDVATNIIYKYI